LMALPICMAMRTQPGVCVVAQRRCCCCTGVA
jgi:hypothetical protein